MTNEELTRLSREVDSVNERIKHLLVFYHNDSKKRLAYSETIVDEAESLLVMCKVLREATKGIVENKEAET